MREAMKRRRGPKEILSAKASIRAFCSECFGHSPREVRDCTDPGCWLYPWRTGTPEERKRTVSEAQRQALTRRLAQSS